MSELSCKLRVTGKAGAARVSVRKHQFIVGRPLTFDVDEEHVTAVEYLLGALGAEIIAGLHEFANRRRLELDAIEAVVDGELGNPLLYFEVVGESGDAAFSRITVKVYVASPHDEDTMQQLWRETLARLPLARTFAASGLGHFTLDLTSRV